MCRSCFPVEQLLEAVEDAYEHGVRREHALFSTLDNLLGRFAVKLAKVSAWIASRMELFAAGNYGHSRTEVDTLLDAHTAFESQVCSLRFDYCFTCLIDPCLYSFTRSGGGLSSGCSTTGMHTLRCLCLRFLFD